MKKSKCVAEYPDVCPVSQVAAAVACINAPVLDTVEPPESRPANLIYPIASLALIDASKQ